ncbi:uncharacterized protein RCO7_10477 [Rhynchosporium graminicola]|uniref:Uncharacterized protein n=1 Tax=Rhynchosporium graminicola TaxID=2792576 RepID=A0A1E1LQY6_9HELO|nr:uncharacterized protein RCO7_10477 [Rhynchosporium commune]
MVPLASPRLAKSDSPIHPAEPENNPRMTGRKETHRRNSSVWGYLSWILGKRGRRKKKKKEKKKRKKEKEKKEKKKKEKKKKKKKRNSGRMVQSRS